MAHNLESTSAPSALGSWMQDLYARIFVQPDDQVSANAFKESIAEDFTAREASLYHKINHDHYTRQSFHDAIMKFRADNKTTIQETTELQSWVAPDGSGAGCVSQFLRFTDSNKETGVGSNSSTLLIASIKVIDGRKMLVELTEVMQASA
ncbi:unnamed protein product [Fusarium fujikuroi]|nr:Uncharacterized protein Y057_3363 [Fusarium fujikuroi]QGI84740.1 hypothetical protein CEK25_011469 [Fusarium fujikuroi]VZI02218.1 unnamed protein product [Fusarium fujikuroi]